MAGRPDPGFFIVGISGDVWNEFCSWFTRRRVLQPPYVVDSIFVARAEARWPRVIAGCCIYPCDGPYAVVEHAATHPDANARLAYEAMLFGARYLAAYGAMRKKAMLCFPATKGMEKLLARAGFQTSAAPVMKHGPWSER